MTHRDVPPDLDASLAPLPDADALRAVWQALPAAAPETDSAARDAAWQRLQARLKDPARTPSPDDDTPVVPLRPAMPAIAPTAARSARPAWAWAAAALLAVLGGGATWRGVPATVAAPVGAVPLDTVLADGSRVILAPGSRLSVSRALGAPDWVRPAARTVRLEGRGFFAVARDGRPFEVRTTDAVVAVLGTRFDVRTPLGGAGTQVAVEEGRVAVTPRQAPSRTVLSAGDIAIVDRGVAARALSADAARLAVWRSGGLAAIDEPLAVVLAEVARRSGREITLDETARAVGLVSVYYPEPPEAATVVADLATAHGLTFTRTSRGFAGTGGASRP